VLRNERFDVLRTLSTGSAPAAMQRPVLHPWLHSAAPVGPKSPSRQHRRKCMSLIRGKDTTPERIVRSVLHRLGFRFALHRADLPGKPDIVMPARRAVVFVHGCYWHMHACKRGRSAPVTNAAFWHTKRESNRKRDRKNASALRRAGWRVLVVWECELKPSNIGRVIERLLAIRETDEPLQRPRDSNSEGRHARSLTHRSHLRAAR